MGGLVPIPPKPYMSNISKGRSPFYPGQPVPTEFFIGRLNEIKRIDRAIGQVELGKPQAIFLTGEYGIGKSSLAGFMRYLAEKHNHLLGIHVLLGGAETLESVATKTVEAAIRSEAYERTITEKIRNLLSKYIGKQELFGFSINLEALKADGPNLSAGYLPFLRQLLERVKENGIKGIMLILDEINGITGNPKFAHFIKSLVDENALSPNPLPLMLMLCGVEERRSEMIQHHQPVERIFDIVEIKPMNKDEMKDFFSKTFNSVNIQVEDEAMGLLCHYSAGFPKIMHIIGDTIFWVDRDNIIDGREALFGIGAAAEDIGRKIVDQQVYKALRSKDYHSILAKLSRKGFDLSFLKGNIEKGLSDIEKKKFNNFLQRMKKLNVLKSGDEQRGEY
ncbi:MAG TPA: ATP-binding protein, partial [Candidatus Brocadiales bacterium]|nr:ATP-binding protein [Candidatus Brocadiales bacterium]